MDITLSPATHSATPKQLTTAEATELDTLFNKLVQVRRAPVLNAEAVPQAQEAFQHKIDALSLPSCEVACVAWMDLTDKLRPRCIRLLFAVPAMPAPRHLWDIPLSKEAL